MRMVKGMVWLPEDVMLFAELKGYLFILRKYSFSMRITNVWNSLPQYIKCA